MFPVVCVSIAASTLCTVWPSVVKWRETGLLTFPCLMSVKCALKRSQNLFPDCPIY